AGVISGMSSLWEAVIVQSNLPVGLSLDQNLVTESVGLRIKIGTAWMHFREAATVWLVIWMALLCFFAPMLLMRLSWPCHFALCTTRHHGLPQYARSKVLLCACSHISLI